MKIETFVDFGNGDYIPSSIAYFDISTKPEDILLKVEYNTELHFDYLGIDYLAKIPAGFITDMGSVPKVARSVVSNTGAIDVIYLLHDAMYGKDWETICPSGKNFTRKDADTILYLGLICRGLSETKAALVYDAVRVGAESHWKT